MKQKPLILVVLGFNDPRIFLGISRYARDAGWRIDLRHFLFGLLPKDPAAQGMIAMYHLNPAVRAYVRKQAKSIPTVILGTRNPGTRAPMVSPDNCAVGRLAAQHLYDRYHKHYGWFACRTTPSGQEHRSAFEERLRELGFSPTDLSCKGTRFRARTVQQHLKRCSKPLGVFARDDQDAAVLLELCGEMGLRTPEDVAVIGVADLEAFCFFSPIPVTSIDPGMEEQGYQAAAVLDRVMRGRKVPDRTMISPRAVVERDSTGGLAITDPRVVTVVHAIDTQFSKPLSVETLAAIAGVSRRQIYVLFRREMRCSPCDYLQQVRLQHACRLIAAGDLYLKQVAKACGFNTACTFNRIFRRRFGVSPSQWAQQHRNR